MPIHDLRCRSCEAVQANVMVKGTDYPKCERCGGETTWIPFLVATDVYGETKTSDVLYEAIGKPATYTSRRELEKKMRAMNFEPAGDKKNGARNEDGYKASSFSFSGKTTRGTPRAARPRGD